MGEMERFLKFVSKRESGCWEWTGNRHHQGYGRFRRGNRILKAHRVSYELHKGDIPEGMFVCHSCDNTACVNPDHLWLGTHDQNMDDMVRKGRANRDPSTKLGERNPAAKLSADDVERIRSLRGKVYQRDVAAEYGICQQMVSRIQTGKNWTTT